jgi:hypothetical protein
LAVRNIKRPTARLEPTVDRATTNREVNLCLVQPALSVPKLDAIAYTDAHDFTAALHVSLFGIVMYGHGG